MKQEKKKNLKKLMDCFKMIKEKYNTLRVKLFTI